MKKIDFSISKFESFLRTILNPTWAWIKRHYLFITFVIILITFLYFLICNVSINYRAWADWTGFGDYTGTLTKELRAKTLWDFLGIILGVLGALLIAILNEYNQNRRKQTEFEIATDQQQEDTLRSYLNDMGILLMEKQLKGEKDKKDSPVIYVAQVKTISTLRSLNRKRRDYVFQFLRDAGMAEFILIGASMDNLDLSENHLYNFNLCGVSLESAKLYRSNFGSANLHGAYLKDAELINAKLLHADLSEAHLQNANLKDANLLYADLKWSNFDEANLFGANLCWVDLRAFDPSFDEISTVFNHVTSLINADLRRADLSHARLSGADLSKANLSWSNLTGAVLNGTDFNSAELLGALVTPQQLSQAKSLKDAIMPDGTIHE